MSVSCDQKMLDVLKRLTKGKEPIRNFTTKLEDEFKYNCWNFTSVINGWEDRIYWQGQSELMETYLNRYTRIVGLGEMQEGDVVVYRDRDNILTHTAIICKDGEKLQIIHKAGDYPLEIADFETYYGKPHSIRRVCAYSTFNDPYQIDPRQECIIPVQPYSNL